MRKEEGRAERKRKAAPQRGEHARDTVTQPAWVMADSQEAAPRGSSLGLTCSTGSTQGALKEVGMGGPQRS